MPTTTDPRYALIECHGGYTVERFDPKRHLCPQGWTYPCVTLFDDRKQVAHLRDQILN